MKFILVLMLYSGWDENSLAITQVEGFSSAKTCQEAGQVFMKAKVGTAYRTEFTCLEVK